MRNQRVLILGANGNMGRRYAAIVRYLNAIPVCVDVDNQRDLDSPATIDAGCCIIATPIDQHAQGIRYCCKHKIPFLCEKPVSKSSAEVARLAQECHEFGVQGWVVNNWAFVASPWYIDRNSCDMISVETYKTGNDGAWDYIQPLSLLKDPTKFFDPKTYPGVRAIIESKGIFGFDFRAECFDESYIQMIQALLSVQELLWPIADSVEAHQRVEAYIDAHKEAV